MSCDIPNLAGMIIILTILKDLHEPCCKNLVLKLIRKNKLSFIKKKFSTSAIAKLVFSIENWENLKNYSGNLTLFKTPKDFR
ncbi:MAG: hypothetical protein EBZ90_03400 [Proteobacteria bacterium]|nr:hypothetical protein [Pseudomonadota bacterium]